MRHSRSKIIVENEWLILSRNATSKPGKKSYTIRVKKFTNKVVTPDQLRAHFDPFGNRGSRSGLAWKYRSLKEAEQLLTMAIMKWKIL